MVVFLAEYVDLYVKYVLEDSIAKQFDEFKKGFLIVTGGPVLNVSNGWVLLMKLLILSFLCV